MRSRVALCVVLVCGLLAGPAQADESRERMLEAVNEVRAEHRLAPFRGSGSLHRSAGAYARWMLRADYFGHLSRIRASSGFSMLGEALAWHSGTAPRVGPTVHRWMNSPPHRALILHPGFRWLGAGLAYGNLSGQRGTTWVLQFGA